MHNGLAVGECFERFSPGGVTVRDIEIGKRHGYADNLRGWFKSLYEILLGQTEGPRFGTFVAFYGPAETAALIRQVLDGRRIDQPAA